MQRLAYGGGQALGVEQIAGQIGGRAQANGADGGQLIALRGDDNNGQVVTMVAQQAQILQPFVALAGITAHAQQYRVVAARRSGVQLMRQLRGFNGSRIGIGPQALQMMAQPLALLRIMSGNDNARGHLPRPGGRFCAIIRVEKLTRLGPPAESL